MEGGGLRVGAPASTLPDKSLVIVKSRGTRAYPADAALVGSPDFLTLGSVAVGQDSDDGVFIRTWGRHGDSKGP